MLKMMIVAGVALMSLAVWAEPLPAQAPSARIVVRHPAELLEAAIASPSGVAYGELRGALYDAMTARMADRGRVLIDVRVLERLPQRGCARLELRVHPERAPGTARADNSQADVAAAMNYCQGGGAPRDGKGGGGSR